MQGHIHTNDKKKERLKSSKEKVTDREKCTVLNHNSCGYIEVTGQFGNMEKLIVK